MEELVEKYAQKMIRSGLADAPLICGLDDDIVWNRQDKTIDILQAVLKGMNINSLICAKPAEPYKTILQYLARRYPEGITPGDCEIRTFLHDLPVTQKFSAETILLHLLKRKSVIIAENNTVFIVTFGTVSPEQAYVNFSSVCFAGFVLFFSEYLRDIKTGNINTLQQEAYQKAVSHLKPPLHTPPVLAKGPFMNEEEVYSALIEAGKQVVAYELVDSYFGNISFSFQDTIYISQTSSSLDELSGCIDPCPLDNSSCTGITASSELLAHSEIFLRTDNKAILHGHPKFSVILSMDCEKKECPDKLFCHIKCSEKRAIADIPIVPGEVGTGPYGLCNTLPSAIIQRRGVIVWGHGLFTVSTDDFNKAFEHLLNIENMCRTEFFERVNKAQC